MSDHMLDCGDADELRAEDRARRRANSTACRCGDDMPGACPGPAACPMCDDGGDDQAGAL